MVEVGLRVIRRINHWINISARIERNPGVSELAEAYKNNIRYHAEKVKGAR